MSPEQGVWYKKSTLRHFYTADSYNYLINVSMSHFIKTYPKLRYNFRGRFFSISFLPPKQQIPTGIERNVCINLLVMRRDWKESTAQLYEPLDDTYFVMEFISKPYALQSCAN